MTITHIRNIYTSPWRTMYDMYEQFQKYLMNTLPADGIYKYGNLNLASTDK